MQPRKEISFGQFRLDHGNECLWQGTRSIPLRPKAFAVLKFLAENPGQLITKQQMLDAVWPGTFVSDAVLKDSIRQLREALGDDASAPAYIETAHRRGYRFIAAVAPTSVENVLSPAQPKSSAPAASSDAIGILGREAELTRLREWLELAMRGERQTVFVTGEAGMGKTTLVEAFLAQNTAGLRVARGQCLEHFGAGEAYLPVLDGISRLCRAPFGGPVLETLRQLAPAWMAQLPSLIPAAEREDLHAHALGATRERMLREMAEALEALTTETPLLLVLEDLHWSDYSTLDLISYLARRRDPARLSIVGTYRPVEVILGDHPLKAVKHELQAHGLCNEIPLEYLGEETVAQYLNARFPGNQLPRRLARLVHRRTEGNPLFMVNVVEYLVDERTIENEQGTWTVRGDLSQAELGVPDSVRHLIERQIERLSPDERTVLEAASVVGMECSSVAIAAGLDTSTEWVEKHCEELARRHQFLSPAWIVELPDGTLTPRHRFNHVLYVEVPYSLLPRMRRAQIHQRIAERGVAVYGERATEIAAELAMHFEQSRDWPRAAKYLCQAAENASHRSAHHEAAGLARRGIDVVKLLPEDAERIQQAITLRMVLAVSLMATKGFASAEVEAVYKEARELCWQQGPSPQLFAMLWSLGLFYIFSGEMESAMQIAQQLLQLAEQLQDRSLIMEAHRAMGVTLLDLGKYKDALEHLDEAINLYAAHRNHPYTVFIGHDCKAVSECFAARALWALGDNNRATERMQEGLTLARKLAHPQTLVVACHFAAVLHQLNGEALPALERAREVVALADEYGLELWLAFGNIDLGWAETELENRARGLRRMRQGLAAYKATGARLWRPHFLGLLTNALSKANQAEEALEAASEAIALSESTGERYSAAELHRLMGTMILKSSGQRAGADEHFGKGLAIARQQEAKAWESRIRQSMDLIEHR